MAKRCEICGKGPMYGNQISHSHRKTRTRWEPNIKTVKGKLGNEVRKIKICMSCLHANKIEIIH